MGSNPPLASWVHHLIPTLQELEYFWLAELPMGIHAWHTINHYTHVPLTGQVCVQHTFIKSCEGICIIGAYVNQQCEPTCHLTQAGLQAWCGCAHTATRPNTLSPLTVLPSAIRRNAMPCLDFFMLPYAPAWERTYSSDSIIALTWNCDGEQRSCDPHTALVDSSHRPTSPWRSMCSCLLLLLSVIKENQPVRRW